MRRAGTRIRIIRIGLRLLFGALFRVRIVGRANVPSTPVILCANHLGWTDAFLVLLFLPVEPRIYVLGEEEVKEISKARQFLIETLRVMVPLDRDKPLEALRTMKGVVSRGGSLLIFPEGHLGTEEGHLLPLQKGAAHLSLQSGAPVLPVGLTGTSKLWLRKQLTVRVGTPIHPDQFSEGAMHDRLDNFTERVATELRALLPGDGKLPKVRLLERWLTKLF